MNEELYILFENYLNNQLSEAKKLDFEKQLQIDAFIAEKFELYKETNGFLVTKFSKETDDFKQNLSSISKSHFTAEKKEIKVIGFKPWYYAVAASIVLAFGTWFMMQNSMPTYEDLNQHQDAYFTERGNVIKNLKLAQDAFNAKNYQEAITNFEIVLKDYKRPEIELYYAISLLEMDKFSESEFILKQLHSGISVYKEKATWYLALSNLKQKKYVESKAFLKQIPEDAEDYDKAQELLNKLD